MLVGGTAAIFLRSTVGAMVTTVVVFLFVPVALTLILREDYGDPQIEVEPISGYARATEYAPNPYFTTDGTWVVAAGYVDSDGTRVSPDESRCAPVTRAYEIRVSTGTRSPSTPRTTTGASKSPKPV